MGVSVREKQKGSNEWWVFVRFKGERVSQKVGDRDIAEDAAADIRKDIRRGVFNLDAMKAARIVVQSEEQPKLPTLKEYFERFELECLRLTVRKSTQKIYSNSFHNHILPAMIAENPDLPDSPLRSFGDFRLDEITRSHVKALVALLVDKKCFRTVNEKNTGLDGTETIEKKKVAFNLSRSSLRIILSALTTCLTNAQREDGLIPANPESVPILVGN